MWEAIAGLLGDVGGSLIGSHSQGKANRINLQIARENRAWQENLANTSIQRRVADLTKAGLNPVLAAGGPGAETPNVQMPRQEATFRPEWTKGAVGTAALLAKQLDNVEASTNNLSAETRIKNNQARLLEQFGVDMQSADLEGKRLSNTEAEAKIKQLGLTSDMTAKQLSKFDRTIDTIVDLLNQQARTGRIELEALENIASVGGIEASKATPIIKTLIQLLLRATK